MASLSNGRQARTHGKGGERVAMCEVWRYRIGGGREEEEKYKRGEGSGTGVALPPQL